MPSQVPTKTGYEDLSSERITPSRTDASPAMQNACTSSGYTITKFAPEPSLNRNSLEGKTLEEMIKIPSRTNYDWNTKQTELLPLTPGEMAIMLLQLKKEIIEELTGKKA